MDSIRNEIVTRQSREENRLLLRARDRNYRAAKLTQGVLIALSVMLPVIGILLGSDHPETRPFVALSSIILLVLETALLDPVQKERLKRGAKLQEQFDTAVFDLPRNGFVVGSLVEPEDIRRLSAKPLSECREKHFETWYESSVNRLPLHVARLVCQRTNISYDGRLRERYGNGLLFLTILFGVALLFVGLALGLTFSDLVVVLFVPFVPVLNWALRERLQHANAAASLASLRAEWDKIWVRALGGADASGVTSDSRDLQDAIYRHRERSPLVFDWVYYRLRAKNEDEARHAANELVEAATKALRENSKV